MNRKVFLSLAMLSALALTGVASASAQDVVQASIPFGFNVGAKALPAGNYEVKRLSATSVLVRNAETQQAAMAITMTTSAPEEPSADATLVFNQYGQSHFLSEIWTRDSGRALSKCKLERRAASRAEESAENESTPHVVYVAARLQ